MSTIGKYTFGNGTIIGLPPDSGSGGGGGEANTGANVGDGIGVFRDKTGVTLNFFSLDVEADMSIEQDGNTILMSSPVYVGTNQGAGAQVYRGKTIPGSLLRELDFRTIVGGDNIIVSVDGDEITITGAEGTTPTVYSQSLHLADIQTVQAQQNIVYAVRTTITHELIPTFLETFVFNATDTGIVYLAVYSSDKSTKFGDLQLVPVTGDDRPYRAFFHPPFPPPRPAGETVWLAIKSNSNNGNDFGFFNTVNSSEISVSQTYTPAGMPDNLLSATTSTQAPFVAFGNVPEE